MADYADKLSGLIYSPREYMEHMLDMDDEEKEARKVFFLEQFNEFNKRKAEKGN